MEFKFYQRNIGGGKDLDGQEKIYYNDYILVKDYRDEILTVNQFLQVAKNYIDTSQSDELISSVTFIRDDPFGDMPKPNSSSDIDEYRIVSFGFTKNNEESKLNKYLLDDIAYWQKGRVSFFLSPIKKDKKKIDSVLKSQVPFKNF